MSFSIVQDKFERTQLKTMNLLKKYYQLDVNFETPSGTTTPVFQWSPLPQRKQLFFTQQHDSCDSVDDGVTELYPNCDVNVWLRSCEKEIIEPIAGTITGEVPKWLNGCLIRNGPGSLRAGAEKFSHLFDSSALLHRFNITNGVVTYQCRFLQSDIYKKNWTANRIVMTEFGTKAVPDPCHTLFQKVAAIFNPTLEQSDNAMISVYPFGDELYAFNEIPIIHKINTETLATEEKVNLSNNIMIVNHTSHPHVLSDGTVYNLAMSIKAGGPYHHILRFPATGKDASQTMFDQAEIVATIPSRWPFHPSYMHTWGITKNYYIIVEQPLSISIPAVVTTKLKNEPLASCFRWYHNELAQINVVSKTTGKLKFKFFAKSFFYLHIINQYEINDEYIILDICMYRDPAMLDCMYVETMKGMQHNPDYAKMFRGRPARFVLPLKFQFTSTNTNLITLNYTKAKAFFLDTTTIFVKPEKICDLGCETPRIYYEKHLGTFYKYFYAISSDVDSEYPGTIIKVDTVSRKIKTWFEKNCYPSEPIFVPNPDAKEEDDGVILAAMVWGGEDSNHVGLLVLEAQSFTELGRAEFKTSSPVPKCLHGWFLPRNAKNVIK